MTPETWTALWLTFKLAFVSTAILITLCAPLSWWLARSEAKWKSLIESIISLPLVLPPTVLGFYLLVTLGPQGFIGKAIDSIGGPSLVFSFPGLVVGSVIYSLPFVAQPMQNAFRSISSEHLESAAMLGASPIDRFFSIGLPLAKNGLIVAAVLGFAHTVGEFGVVLMIGGNIPGETQVMSVAIYEFVEGLEYGKAHFLAGILLGFSFLLLLFVYSTNRKVGVFSR